MPGPGWYWIGEEEKREVLDVIESGHLVRYGKLDDPRFKQKTRLFEKEFAAHCGASMPWPRRPARPLWSPR